MMERKFKDSGIEWIGKVPETWEVTKLNTLYTQRNEKVSDRDYPPLSVTMKGILPQLETAAKTDNGDDRKLVRIGDFAINSRSDRRGSCGISPYEGSVSLINTILKPRGEMNPNYYNWLFHSSFFSDEFYKWGHGIVNDLWTTRWQEMRNIAVPSPTLEVQQRIADYLDTKCGEIDSLIGLQEQMIEKLKAYKQSVITEAVTKGLDPNAKLVPSGIDWIGEIPEGWKVMRMKFLGTFQNGLTYTPYDVCGADGILVLRSSNIQDAKLTFDDNVFVTKAPEELMVKKGDIIICSRNGSASLVGKCALVEEDIQNCSFGAFMVRFRSIIFQKYAFYLVSTVIPQYKQLFTTTTINQLTKGMLSSMMGVLPSMDEQQSIASFLDEKCADIDRLITLKQQKIEALKDYKKSVIYEAVTGKTEIKG